MREKQISLSRTEIKLTRHALELNIKWVGGVKANQMFKIMRKLDLAIQPKKKESAHD